MVPCQLDEQILSWNGGRPSKRLTTSNLKVQLGTILGPAFLCRGIEIIEKLFPASSFEEKWIGLMTLTNETNLEKFQYTPLWAFC